MISKLQIRPAQGLLIRDPKTQALIPAEGATVERSTYWERRLKDGDVIAVEDAPEKTEEIKSDEDKSDEKKAKKEGNKT